MPPAELQIALGIGCGVPAALILGNLIYLIIGLGEMWQNMRSGMRGYWCGNHNGKSI